MENTMSKIKIISSRNGTRFSSNITLAKLSLNHILNQTPGQQVQILLDLLRVGLSTHDKEYINLIIIIRLLLIAFRPRKRRLGYFFATAKFNGMMIENNINILATSCSMNKASAIHIRVLSLCSETNCSSQLHQLHDL